MKLGLTILFVLLVVPLFGRPSIDVIVMKNGDRLTCEIKQLRQGVLYVGLDYVDGNVSVQWSKVDHIESSQLFLVQTQDGSTYEGELRTASKPGEEPVTIEIVESAENKKAFVRQQVVEMAQASESFWRSFTGSLSSGMTYTRGNETRTFSLNSEISYLRPQWRSDLQYQSSLSGANHDPNSKRNEVTIIAQRLLPWNNWYYTGVGDFLQSSQQSINSQATVGGGIGRYFKNTDRTQISLIAGLAFENTQYSELPVNPAQNSAAGLVVGNVQWFIFKKTNLSLKASFLPILNQPGRTRFDTNSSYSIQLISNLWWNFSFYGNWDTNPPGNLKGSDYGTTSGLTYTFNSPRPTR